MKALLYIAAALLFTSSYAQEVKGKITSESGPVFPASILVIEQSKTLNTDKNGNFSFTLKVGQYHLEISSENYTSKNIIVNVSNKDIDLGNIVLAGKEEKLDEIVLEYYSSGERKAMDMRKNSNAIMDVVSADAMGKKCQTSVQQKLYSEFLE